MIWADRVALGVAALLVLIAAFTVPSQVSGNEKEWATYRENIAKCASLRLAKPGSDEATLYSLTCPPLAPDTTLTTWGEIRADAPEVASFVLTLWIVLRILDFMIGGPGRRARNRV